MWNSELEIKVITRQVPIPRAGICWPLLSVRNFSVKTIVKMQYENKSQTLTWANKTQDQVVRKISEN